MNNTYKIQYKNTKTLIYSCLILLTAQTIFIKTENAQPKQFKLPDEFITVDFHKNMILSNCYDKNFAEKDPQWQKIKSLYDEHVVKNQKYSEQPRIPKIIHQIWLGNNGKLPEKYYRLQKTWLDNHPDWKYILWTEKEIEDFKLERKDLYDEADNYGSKTDIARYEIIYRLGGLYVDTDFECIKEFDTLNHICDFYVGLVYNRKVEMCNALIGACPGHPILRACIDNLKHKRPGKESMGDVMYRTGPYYFTECFFKAINKCTGPSVAFPRGYFFPWPSYARDQNSPAEVKKWINPETFGIHHWLLSWAN